MQTPQEKAAIANYWFDHLAPAGFLNTEHNARELGTYLHKENIPFSFENLTRAAASLGDMAEGGRLQFNTKTKIVYQAPEKTTEEIAREHREKFERAHAQGLYQRSQHHRTEFDRGSEDKAPILTEEQKAVINARNKQQDQIISDVWHKIQTYTGRVHGRTFSGRAELTKVFEDGMDKRLKAEQIEKLVDAKLEKLSR